MAPPTLFWAKLSDDGSRWHPLFAHSADVGAVFACLIRPGSRLDARLAATQGIETLSPAHRARLVYLAVLHDVGKVNHGFQEKGRDTPRVPARGHVKVLLESARHPGLRACIGELTAPLGLDREGARELFGAAIAHHGRPWKVQPTGRWFPLWERANGIPRDPLAEIRRLGALALRWSGLGGAPDGPPLRVTPALTHLFAGALTLADWVASTEEAFPYTPDADPETYWTTAQRRAEDPCRAIGLSPAPLALEPDRGEPLLRRIFPAVFPAGEDRTPTPLQTHLASMELPPPGSRLVVESETGSGKTEAALTLFARLRAAGQVDGLVFALPTRATATAMHERVLDALHALYGDAMPSVALAVGGTQPRAEANRGALTAERQTYDDDTEEDAAAARAALARWATQGAKRFMAAEVVVGTLDQLLLGALPVRHAHLRLAGLTRHLLVVDELHSYDRFMSGVLRRLLDLHTGHGGTALFLSATLAERTRHLFGAGAASDESPVTRDAAVERAYPSLSIQRPGGDWEEKEMPSPGTPKTVHWDACSLPDALADAVRAARLGARVLVVRNTVRGARAAVDALVAMGAGGLLWCPRRGATPAYHSRYDPADRKRLDEHVREQFGREGPGRGVILVATQVAEQSLDVDFDLLVTDLCPVDVLLQRIGRLWRHPERTDRPGCPEARVRVVVPEGGLEPLRQKKFGGENGWGNVYPDVADLHLTRGLLGKAIQIPRDNRRLVEAVYHRDPREALAAGDPGGWGEYLDKRSGAELATTIHALHTALDFARLSYVQCAPRFSAAEEQRIRTRLGDDRVRVPLDGHPERVPCRYAPDASLAFVDLPERVVLGSGVDLASPQVTDWAPFEGGVRCRLGCYELRYDDGGWQWERRGDGAAGKDG